MGNKSSVQSVSEVKSNHQLTEESEGNDWADAARGSAYNGWDPSGGSSGIKDQGWLDKPAEALHNGWGERVTESIGDEDKCSSCKSPHLEVRSNGWMDEAAARGEYHGWSSDPSPTKQEYNGWASEPIKDEYNGWGVVEPEHNATVGNQDTQTDANSQPCIRPNDSNPSFAPSAPPIPEEFLHEEVNSSPILSTITHEIATKSGSSSCIICWDSPVEGACVPCGHMVGCMSCLNEIESKKGDCPICRVKIGQVIKLYAV